MSDAYEARPDTCCLACDLDSCACRGRVSATASTPWRSRTSVWRRTFLRWRRIQPAHRAAHQCAATPLLRPASAGVISKASGAVQPSVACARLSPQRRIAAVGWFIGSKSKLWNPSKHRFVERARSLAGRSSWRCAECDGQPAGNCGWSSYGRSQRDSARREPGRCRATR